MRIGVFTYNFEHSKTQEGLIQLFLEGYKVNCIFAQNPIKLKFYQSKIRITPKGLKYFHPLKIANKLEIPYYVLKHNSKVCKNLIKKYNLDLGIILGARILSKEIISSFNIGILNLHPALLPENRGLDNIKWSILKNIKQGVTTHLISSEIDKGYLLLREEIKVYKDDTLLDIQLRVLNKQYWMMIKSIKLLEHKKKFKKLSSGTYFKAVPSKLEKDLFKKFERYKNGIK